MAEPTRVGIGQSLIRVFLAGFAVGGSLIIAIGAQNATLLRIGLRQDAVGVAVAICIFGDATLIALGIGGLGTALQSHSAVLTTLTVAGAVYLGWFSLNSWRSAWRGTVGLSESTSLSRSSVLTTMLVVTFLNPHVYVDTVMVLGTVSARFTDRAWIFGAGALTCSVLWFSALGFGARLVRPHFQRPVTWRILDLIVGTVTFTVAVSLIRSL